MRLGREAQAGASNDDLAAGGRGLGGVEGRVMQGEGADRPGGSGARLGREAQVGAPVDDLAAGGHGLVGVKGGRVMQGGVDGAGGRIMGAPRAGSAGWRAS